MRGDERTFSLLVEVLWENLQIDELDGGFDNPQFKLLSRSLQPPHRPIQFPPLLLVTVRFENLLSLRRERGGKLNYAL